MKTKKSTAGALITDLEDRRRSNILYMRRRRHGYPKGGSGSPHGCLICSSLNVSWMEAHTRIGETTSNIWGWLTSFSRKWCTSSLNKFFSQRLPILISRNFTSYILSHTYLPNLLFIYSCPISRYNLRFCTLLFAFAPDIVLNYYYFPLLRQTTSIYTLIHNLWENRLYTFTHILWEPTLRPLLHTIWEA